MGKDQGGLAAFYAFFGTSGTARLDGLGYSYFVGLTDSEKEEAWNFLLDGFPSSRESIGGLFNLDWAKAVVLFKEAVERPLETSPYPAQQKAIEENRLLMLRHINSVEADEKYLAAMCKFSKSQFKDVRTAFAQCVPVYQVTHEAVSALKNMVLSETDTIVLASAVPKLMEIYGMEFDRKSSTYKSIYMSLSSDDPVEKTAGITRLEQYQAPDYIPKNPT